MYTEDKSKNNQGGLYQKDRAPKKVTHYANEECPQRCLVRIFKTYNSRCPPDRPAHALYLKALKRPKGEVWFQKAPIGHNTLSKTVSRLMSSANIPGKFSNHSLRSTSTTRLYNAHVDEQLIMLRTGHSSTKGVRCYKRTSEQLLEETSDILNKKRKLEDIDNTFTSGDDVESTSKQSKVADPSQANASSSSFPFGVNITSSTVNFNIYNCSK